MTIQLKSKRRRNLTISPFRWLVMVSNSSNRFSSNTLGILSSDLRRRELFVRIYLLRNHNPLRSKSKCKMTIRYLIKKHNVNLKSEPKSEMLIAYCMNETSMCFWLLWRRKPWPITKSVTSTSLGSCWLRSYCNWSISLSPHFRNGWTSSNLSNVCDSHSRYWDQFVITKDYKDIQTYISKEYDVFKVYFDSMHDKIQ